MIAHRQALCGLIPGLFLMAITTGSLLAGEEQEVPRGPHGAATEAYQEEKLDELLQDVQVDQAPPGLDPVIWKAFIPDDNEMTAERVALGRRLYFDPRLSMDRTVSCATCHDVTRGFTDQREVSEGFGGQLGRRNAPTTLNTVLLQTLFLDGRSPTLEHQAKLPIINPIEMAMPDHEAAVKAIQEDEAYQKLFQSAYGRDANIEDIGRAIAAFERVLVFTDSPFRRFLEGDNDAITADARKGWALFNGEARCVTCHQMNPANPIGTDNRFHNIGVAARHQDFEALAKEALQALEKDTSDEALDKLALNTDLSELGRFMVTKNRADIGGFRTSMLLNIGITPPYMHDGSMDTLWDVMDHYNKGGESNLFLDGGMEPLGLTEEEIDQVVEFLFALTDDRFAEENQKQVEKQKAYAAENRPFRDDDIVFEDVLLFERRVAGPKGLEQ